MAQAESGMAAVWGARSRPHEVARATQPPGGTSL
jgi:hypothetical protein